MNENTITEVVSDAEVLPALLRADAPAIWKGYEERLRSLKTTAETLTVTDVSQKAEMKLADNSRKALKSLRCEIENKRKEMGEDALRQKQAIDRDAKTLIALIEPLEARLQEQATFVLRLEEKRKSTLRAERIASIVAIWPEVNELSGIEDMDEETWGRLADGARARHAEEQRKQAEAEAERVRLEEERAAKEMERALENARLKREAAAAEKARQEAEEKARLEREEAERLAAAERARVEAERKAAEEKAAAEKRAIEEAARKEREALEAKAKAEREEQERIAAEERRAAAERERIEREAREKVEAELRAREAAEAKAKKEAAEAAKKAAQAPDREKLAAFIAQVEGLSLPKFTTEAGTAAGIAAASLVAELARGLKSHLSTL